MENHNLKLSLVFEKITNKINECCSKNCEIDNFEDFMIHKNYKILEKNKNYHNYEDSLTCFKHCSSKYFSSSILSVQVLNQGYNLVSTNTIN